jgi:hypothetical protein
MEAQKLFERTAEKSQYHQRRNAAARVSHTKTTRRILKQHGIRFSSPRKPISNTS